MHSRLPFVILCCADACTVSQGVAEQLAAAEREAGGQACLAVLSGHTATVTALLAAPCADAGADAARFVLATASLDGALRLWDAGSGGTCAHTTVAYAEGGVVWASCAPDGASVATAGADGALRLWRLDERDARAAAPTAAHALQGHSARVTCGAFTLDSERLISGAADCSVRVWRVVDGTCERILGLHAKYITCMVRLASRMLHAFSSLLTSVCTAHARRCLRMVRAWPVPQVTAP
jgi:WD40 repeat protein